MTKVTIKLIPVAKLDAEITAFHKSGQNFQTRAHRLACSVLAKLIQDGDVRTVLKFINAMPEMGRVNGLKAWFEAHGPIKFHEEKEVGLLAAHVKGKDANKKLGDGMAKPFWKFSAKEGAPYEPVDLNKELDRLVARLTKDAAKTGRDHTATLNVLKTLRPEAAKLEQANIQ